MYGVKTLKSKIGKIPLCNGKPERAPQIGGFCFPLCWRCSSFIVGCWIMCAVNTSLFIMNPYASMISSLLLVTPCVYDSVSQYCFGHISTNRRRAITGFLAGIGLVVLSDAVYGIICI